MSNGNINYPGIDPIAIAQALSIMPSSMPSSAPLGGGWLSQPKKACSRVIGTVQIGNDKERVFNLRQQMTVKQIKAIRKVTGGNRTTHVLMRAKSQFG